LPGLYIHIPFCKQACSYCNFHFSTSLGNKNELLEALVQELRLRKDYLEHKNLDSIYFGGGTPSLLSAQELDIILEEIAVHFSINEKAEITLEANPDDLELQKLRDYKALGLNRLSIGIQSFGEQDLKFMNRVHNSQQGIAAIEMVQQAGFENFSIDLIYGTPGMKDSQWLENLNKTFELQIPHVSAYCLTVEPKTALAHNIAKGDIQDVDEEQAARQFEMLMTEMELHGYVHYEISNFCKPGFKANHNSSYWIGEPYLGIGPSAHSYNGSSRQWNVSNNSQYQKAIQSDDVPAEIEELNSKQRFNEYLMCSLRTMEGCDPVYVKETFGEEYADLLLKNALVPLENALLESRGSVLKLTRKGKLLADNVISDLFMD